jgi:serine/threonine-protein kinase RsbW
MYSIQVSCNKQNLKEIRNFVERTLDQYHLAISDSDMNMMVLAIDEVCANLMIHSHQCNPSENIEIRIQDKSERLMFEVLETSLHCGFNLSEYEVPDVAHLIKNKRNGGIGLILVKKIMDEIELERRGSTNIYRFYKSFRLTRNA